MFKDVTDYKPTGDKVYVVAVDGKPITEPMTHAEALKIAQRTKMSAVKKVD